MFQKTLIIKSQFENLSAQTSKRFGSVSTSSYDASFSIIQSARYFPIPPAVDIPSLEKLQWHLKKINDTDCESLLFTKIQQPPNNSPTLTSDLPSASNRATSKQRPYTVRRSPPPLISAQLDKLCRSSVERCRNADRSTFSKYLIKTIKGKKMQFLFKIKQKTFRNAFQSPIFDQSNVRLLFERAKK